jgi:hypothetical protein
MIRTPAATEEERNINVKSMSLSTSLSNMSSLKSVSNSDLALNSRTFTMSEQDALFSPSASHSPMFVDITPLSNVPGCTTVNHYGRLSIHFVKEDLNLHHFHGHHYTDAYHYNDAVLDDGLGTFIHKVIQ